jgi:hypothetical protein
MSREEIENKLRRLRKKRKGLRKRTRQSGRQEEDK